MATPGAAFVQNLAESRAEALQALLNSISPGSVSSSQDEKTSTQEQARRISDKLTELLGEEALAANGPVQKRNEKGELLNEEGLPIIDIVEPVSDAAAAPPSEPIHVFDDPDLLPFWALSPAEKARRRAERERMLDILEEEERTQQERDEKTERERRLAEMERKKDAAKTELDEVRKARELQKKMGRALLRNIVDAKEKKEKERALSEKEDQQHKEERKLKPKKSVTFADPPGEEDVDNEAATSLADISLGRLERKGKNTLMAVSRMDKQSMMMNVVERQPHNASSSSSIRLDASKLQDSDDESVPGSPADSDEGEVIYSDHSDEDDQPAISHLPPDSDSTDVDQDEDEPVVWQDEDFNFAQHQREIALAYYEKRATIGLEVSSALKAHCHDGDESEWNQPEVPLEATLASAPPKPSVSRFKAEQYSSNSLASHSLGPSVLPSSQSSSLKGAIRMGKVEDRKLIGEAEDSEDEGEREAREIWELLTRGQVENVGPQTDHVPSQVVGNMAPAALEPVTSTPTSRSLRQDVPVDGPSSPPKSKASRVSKFKLTLAQTREQPRSELSSTQNTPISLVERSSPKSTTSELRTPIAAPSSSSRSPQSPHNPPHKRSSTSAPPSPISASVQRQMPMVVESPSVRPPTISRSSTSSPLRSAPIVNSYSQSPITIDDSPFVVIDSPSFQNPSLVPRTPKLPVSSASPALGQRFTTTPVREPADSVEAGVSERPVTAMTAEVKESSGTRGRIATLQKERKVSKFLAERL